MRSSAPSSHDVPDPGELCRQGLPGAVCRMRTSGFRRSLVPRQSVAPDPAPRAVARSCNPRSAPAKVTRGQPPELEGRSSGRHDRVLRGEITQRLLVARLDNREAV